MKRKYALHDTACVKQLKKLNGKNRTEPEGLRLFKKIIKQYYRKRGRSHLPWRGTENPYNILVSEIMLQQTQVERVIEKYEQFITAFPDFASLAKASFQKILSVWQGLGYNRRAIALHNAARIVVKEFNGLLPSSADVLATLPGIGKATASSIAAFAFNKPTVFIETNIRRVFIHFFFHDQDKVQDKELLPLIEKTLIKSNPRDWYYALMDYGVMLKKSVPNPNIKSAHYQKQSPFEGSRRQVRGKILRAVLEKPNITEAAIVRQLRVEAEKVKEALAQLHKEGFLTKKGRGYLII